ncbi:type VII secretion target [Nocardia amamiensis]|uniref:type VII secretion target n=1 Tax=Nocardia TaxID=1817 RepID=UPI0033C52075
MTEPLDIDLDLLRQLAIHHAQEADNIRARVAPPNEWLDSYLARYGNIALPVYHALLRYVDARQENGNALADTHQRTADHLRTVAWQMELADQEHGRSIQQAGSDRGHSNSPHAAYNTGTPAASSSYPISTTSTNTLASDLQSPDTYDRSATGKLDDTGTNDATAMAMPGAGFGGRDDTRETAPAHAAYTSDQIDLDLARRQLSTIINTAPDIPGLDWAVSVMRAGDLVQTFVTSNHGRGWLPAGVQLPSTIATPWAPKIADTLDGADTAWEDAFDPARILVEFGSIWGPRHQSRVTALVTTGPLDESLHSAVPDAAIEGEITPGLYPVDTTAGLADRLSIYSSGGLDSEIDTVPDTVIRAGIAGLASDAHTRIGRRNRDGGELRQLRERLLTQLVRGQAIPSAWWAELRHADATRTEQYLSTAAFSGAEPPPAQATEAARTLALELHADELLLLLANEPSRQLLRDAAYSYAQIVNHPLLDTGSSNATPASPTTITAPTTVAPPPPVNLSNPASQGYRDGRSEG